MGQVHPRGQPAAVRKPDLHARRWQCSVDLELRACSLPRSAVARRGSAGRSCSREATGHNRCRNRGCRRDGRAQAVARAGESKTRRRASGWYIVLMGATRNAKLNRLPRLDVQDRWWCATAERLALQRYGGGINEPLIDFAQNLRILWVIVPTQLSSRVFMIYAEAFAPEGNAPDCGWRLVILCRHSA